MKETGTTTIAKALVVLWALPVTSLSAQQRTFDLLTASVADIQEAVAAGALTYERLVQLYLNRIEAYDQQGPKLNAVLEIHPRALEIARELDEERRTSGLEYLFSWKGKPLSRISNTSWKKSKARASLPIRFHDLRHTFGHRLRAVGASIEDRKALMGHTSSDITTHYSAAELETLLEWVEKIVDARPSTALRTGLANNVVELRQNRGKLPSKDAVLN